MINQWNRLAKKALVGQNSQPTTLDIWKHNARLTSNMFKDSKTTIIDGLICRTCKFPVLNPR